MNSPLSQAIQRSMPVIARRVALGEFRDQMPKLFSSRSDRSALNPYSRDPEIRARLQQRPAQRDVSPIRQWIS
jgi:hypothetical protein